MALLFILAALWSLAPLVPSNLSAEVIDRVAVVIDREPHTLAEIKGFAERKMRHDLTFEDLTRVDASSKEILEEFITDQLLSSEAKRLGIKISEEDIDQYIASVQKRTGLTSAQLSEVLRREGMDMKRYRTSIGTEIKNQELIKKQVKKKVNITAADVERYYQANRRKYRTKEKVRLRHILVRVLKDAPPEEERAAFDKVNRIRERALQGKDFSRLVRENSEGGGAFQGGDIGWVERKSLLKEIAEVAFKLSEGEISPPVRTSLGVHLVKVEGLQPAGTVPLAQLAKTIKAELRAKTLNERFEKWIRTDLRKKHRVVVKLDGFVFRAEQAKEGTVKSLMVSNEKDSSNERSSMLSYLNPLSYIISKSPAEDEESENLTGESVGSIFGMPFFLSESAEEVPEGAVVLPGEVEPVGESAGGTEESPDFFSSILDTVNPF